MLYGGSVIFGRVFLGVLGVFFLLCGGVLAQGERGRVEPPFWWVGMKEQELQVLIYGKGVGFYEVEVSGLGVKLLRAETVESPNYLFLYLDVSEAKAGTFKIEFSHEGAVRGAVNYELKERRRKGEDFRGFDGSDVIYLVTPDRFANGDLGNDDVEGMMEKSDRGEKGGRHGGDLAGLVKNLGYLEQMGFTQLWLMPVTESNMKRGSYHGYAATDYYKIDPRYGTNAQYLELSRRARKKGIGLIMDMVPNHCGSEHWWFKDQPTKDWINNGGVYRPSNHHRESVQGIGASEEEQRAFTDGWFAGSMPDLNQRNPHLATYLTQNAIWWVEFAELSGIRVDTFPYSDKTFLADWTGAIMREYPKLNMVGEEWSENPQVIAYWLEGAKNRDGYKCHLPTAMDFPLNKALLETFKQEAIDFWSLYDVLKEDPHYPDASKLVVFADNHDKSRVFTELNENPALTKMALTFILTTRGVPQVFYGTELLKANPGTDDHGVIRSDFPGGWVGDRTNAFTRRGLSKKEAEMQSFMRTLLQWRKNSQAIHQGSFHQHRPEDGVYVYFRESKDDLVMVVMNGSGEEREINPERYDSLKGRSTSAKEVISQKKMPLDKRLTLPPYTAWVLEVR